jgi:hypothetical protein
VAKALDKVKVKNGSSEASFQSQVQQTLRPKQRSRSQSSQSVDSYKEVPQSTRKKKEAVVREPFSREEISSPKRSPSPKMAQNRPKAIKISIVAPKDFDYKSIFAQK